MGITVVANFDVLETATSKPKPKESPIDQKKMNLPMAMYRLQKNVKKANKKLATARYRETMDTTIARLNEMGGTADNNKMEIDTTR